MEHRWAKNEQPNDRDTVEDALVLGAYRRLYRDLNAPPLAPVRSLRYFGGLIEEILAMEVCPDGYFQYLRYRIKTFEQSKQTAPPSQANLLITTSPPRNARPPQHTPSAWMTLNVLPMSSRYLKQRSWRGSL